MIYLFSQKFTSYSSYIHHFYDYNKDSYIGVNCSEKTFYDKKYYYYIFLKNRPDLDTSNIKPQLFTVGDDEYTELEFCVSNSNHEFCENYMLNKILEKL